jgi:nitrogen fixation/metabolism regulation signal transduction histidine kinase
MANHRGTTRRKPKRQSLAFEARLRIFCTVAALVFMGLCAAILLLLHVSAGPMLATLGILLLVLLLLFAAFIEEAIRPIQTLANVVAALREEDYSFRARGANRDDSVGQLSLEINALADTLQTQRVASLEAVALLRRVIAEMDAPVLAFDQETRLRLLNPAAERVFSLEPAKDLGKTAAELTLTGVLEEPSETVLQLDIQRPSPLGVKRAEPSQPARWMIRRGEFRQRGVPHTLVVMSDVSAALREEERLAWRRLIRVIGHEISNSLTPIKSIAGSLRTRLLPKPPNGTEPQADSAPATLAPATAVLGRDLQRGLSVIENRAESLNRFVQAYRQLAQLPSPILKRVPLQPLLERVVSLEIRLDVRLLSAPDVELLADTDQIEQLLINLVRNAVESALTCVEDPEGSAPSSTAVILNDAQRSEEPGLSELSQTTSRTAPRVSSTSENVAASRLQHREAPPCRPEVTIKAIEEGDLVCIAIEDNGPGLANPENLFVPLYTTKKAGSGVGLALARQIVEAHGGVIDLRNKPNHTGCIAEVRIPMAEGSRQ